MRPKSRRSRRLKPPLLNVARNMGKWKPQDDFLLIQSVTQLNSLEETLGLTEFTSNFSIQDLKERWYSIMYDAPISKMIYKNIKKLHPDDVLRLKRLAPFSESENKLLTNLNKDIDNESFFETFLTEHRTKFHESRTSDQLENQYKTLKDLKLLECQLDESISDNNDETMEISFNNLEDRLNDQVIAEAVTLNTADENDQMAKSYESLLHEIKRAEADVFLWQVLVDKVTDRPNPFAAVDTLAVLFSAKTEFVMNKKEMIIGRSSSSVPVDIDLNMLNANKKISRKQCVICHIKSNLFFLFNCGKQPVFVDGSPVVTNSRLQINDKSLIEIGDISMIFLVNYNIISLDDSIN